MLPSCIILLYLVAYPKVMGRSWLGLNYSVPISYMSDILTLYSLGSEVYTNLELMHYGLKTRSRIFPIRDGGHWYSLTYICSAIRSFLLLNSMQINDRISSSWSHQKCYSSGIYLSSSNFQHVLSRELGLFFCFLKKKYKKMSTQIFYPSHSRSLLVLARRCLEDRERPEVNSFAEHDRLFY